MADPQAQVMGIAAGVDVPGDVGGLVGMLKEKFPKLADHIIKAYHGSPHDFEQFSLEKIGTGEGAQAYGHGLYFAENQQVAKDYQKSLAGADLTLGGKAIQDVPDLTPVQQKALTYLSERGIRPQDLDSRDIGDVFRSVGGQQGEWPAFAKDWRGLIDRGVELGKPRGKMYEVAIKAHPDQFLDWDKPLSQQTNPQLMNIVRDSLKKQGYLRPTDDGPRQLTSALASWKMEHGGMAETTMESMLSRGLIGSTPEETSQILKDAGIPGIKYFDQGSRVAGKGSRNYVVFDDQTVEILKKYGLLPPVAGALLNQQGTDDAGSH
jgi:hypothetical protein